MSTAEIKQRIRERGNKGQQHAVTRNAIGQFLGKPPKRPGLVTAIGLLHFLPNPAPVVERVARLLSDNGHFILTYDPFIPGHPIHGERQSAYEVTVYRSAPADMEDILRQNGLEVVSDQSFVPQPNGNTEYRGRFVVAKKTGHSYPDII